jgi:general secretion pathway protein C
VETLLRKYLWAIDLAVVAICAVFSARATGTFIEASLRTGPVAKRAPRLPVAAPQATVYSKQVEEILNRNIFCSTCPPILQQKTTENPVASGPPPLQKTSLPLKLLAVMYAPTAPAWSMAIIRDTEAKTAGAFGIGSQIREAKVTSIEEARVYLEIGGRQEYMDLLDNKPPPPTAAATPAPSAPVASAGGDDPLMKELDKGIKKTGEHSYEVQRATVDSLLGNMSMLSRSARIVPEIRDGRAAGFRLFSVRPDGPFAKIGLQNGDVISAINGLEMTSPDKALEVYTKLKSASHLSVGLERNGQKITKDYSIR